MIVDRQIVSSAQREVMGEPAVEGETFGISMSVRYPEIRGEKASFMGKVQGQSRREY